VPPIRVAITGGIAAGKSETLAAFARHGAATASSDAVVHDLLADDEDVRAAIRARIGDIVFHDRDELTWLEQLLHPKTRAAIDAWLAHVDTPLAVVEVPLLYETGGESRFDKVVVVTASPAAREARRALVDDRQARLISDEEKLQRADFSYVNDGSLDALDAFVAGVVENLLSSSAG
jgi:dephospho-CoA kinase